MARVVDRPDPYTVVIAEGEEPHVGGRRKYDPALVDLVRAREGGSSFRAASELRKLAKEHPDFYGVWRNVTAQAVDHHAGICMSGQPPELVYGRTKTEMGTEREYLAIAPWVEIRQDLLHYLRTNVQAVELIPYPDLLK